MQRGLRIGTGALLVGVVAMLCAGHAVAATSTCGMPCLSLQKTGPDCVNVNCKFTYELVVANTGSGTALNVAVRDTLPAGAQYVSAVPAAQVSGKILSWGLGNLEAGQSKNLKITVLATKAGKLRNCATMTYTAQTCVDTCVLQPKLVVTKTGPTGEVCINKDVCFTITVKNTGNGTASNVVLVDNLPKGLTPKGSNPQLKVQIGALAPGESKSFQVNTKAVAAGNHCNTVVVTGDCGLRAQASACVKVVVPQLNLCKVGPAKVFLKKKVTYTISASNPGNGTAPNLVLTDHLPPGMTYVGASHNGSYDATNNTVVWALGDMKPGAAKAVTVTLKATSKGKHCNKVMGYTCCGITKWAEVCTEVVGVPGVLLEMVDDQDALQLNDVVTYTITVTNQGTTDLHNVKIAGDLDPTTIGVSATDGGIKGTIKGKTFSYEALKVLPVGASKVYYVKVKPTKPADTRIKIRLTAKELRSPVHEQESTHFYDCGER
jgi:uncharacterized repeat protein (TIGR01451 family)